MSDTITTLQEFIDSARRSRKYPDNTAMALKTALRLFETELNDEEKSSVEKFNENLDRIYQSVFEKNKTKYSSGSLDTYRRRISKLVGDYLNYGTDPAKMNNWSPPVRKFSHSTRASSSKKVLANETDDGTPKDSQDIVVPEGGARLDWPLSEGRKAILILPSDLTSAEAKTINQLVTLRVNETSGGEKVNPQAA